MNESKITSAGQTTIPVAVRKYLGLKGGDKVRYFFDDGKVVMVLVTTSIHELEGFFPKPDKVITLEEMDDSIAEAAIHSIE